MHALGPGAVRQVLDDARCHAAGNAERRNELRSRQTERGAHTPGCGHRTEHRRRMEAGVVRRHWGHETQSAHQLDARHNTDQEPVTAQIVPFTRSKNGRDNDRTGVNRTAFECVVEVFAVRGSPIHKCRAAPIEASAMAQHRAWTAALHRGKRRGDVVFAPCGDAQT
jgi:hypothetical protein